jgi:PPOX class probable F420-dependent enzyme
MNAVSASESAIVGARVGRMPAELKMSVSEREQFLADLHVGLLAVSQPGAPPTVSPIWYEYEPGGDVRFNTDLGAVKHTALEAAGEATLCVQREEYPYAYVTVEGPIAIDEARLEQRTRIAARYLGAEGGAAYVKSTAEEPVVLVRLTPRRWFTQDFARFSLPSS